MWWPTIIWERFDSVRCSIYPFYCHCIYPFHIAWCATGKQGQRLSSTWLWGLWEDPDKYSALSYHVMSKHETRRRSPMYFDMRTILYLGIKQWAQLIEPFSEVRKNGMKLWYSNCKLPISTIHYGFCDMKKRICLHHLWMRSNQRLIAIGEKTALREHCCGIISENP